ncbi:MAG TPA: NADH-quinone oxidoreductase subunit C [Nitrososphaerales archaeon]|nr:NADH-quinone oxidoreductase subunit C [Nitrososphaerales archaeon]
MSVESMQAIAAETGGTVTTSKKAVFLNVSREKVPEACAKVAAMPGYYHLSTITALDLGDQIAVLYHFWKGKTFAVVKTLVPKTDARIPSITPAVPAAVFYEAEVKDLMGIFFDGNPYMKGRFVLPDEYPTDAPAPLRREADPAKIRKMLKLE